MVLVLVLVLVVALVLALNLVLVLVLALVLVLVLVLVVALVLALALALVLGQYVRCQQRGIVMMSCCTSTGIFHHRRGLIRVTVRCSEAGLQLEEFR